MTPALTSHAMNAINATGNAVPAASALNRDASPPLISPSDAPMGSGGSNGDGRVTGSYKRSRSRIAPNKQA